MFISVIFTLFLTLSSYFHPSNFPGSKAQTRLVVNLLSICSQNENNIITREAFFYSCFPTMATQGRQIDEFSPSTSTQMPSLIPLGWVSFIFLNFCQGCHKNCNRKRISVDTFWYQLLSTQCTISNHDVTINLCKYYSTMFNFDQELFLYLFKNF